MHTQLLVLGGGPGGYAAAFLAADLGMDVTLVEADNRLGGTCLLRGCIPSKALLHVSKAIAEADHLSEWGVEYTKPKIDINTMRARKEKVISTLTGGLGTLAKKRKVNVIQALGVFEDSRRLRLDAIEGAETPPYDCLTYDHCILATGSQPAVPKIFQLDTDRVMDSTGALELKDKPESLLVIGGGYIGLEMGSVYAGLGTKVTVVEMMDGLLMGADRDLVKPLVKRLDAQFEAIHLSTKVVSLEDKGKSVAATLEGPDGKSWTAEFDRVLVSIGRRPNTEGIGLETTKVVLTDRGFVQINKQQQTNDPVIYAIGDVAGEPMLAHKAAAEAKVAVETLHGEPAAFDAAAIPAVVFTDPELAWCGLTEEQAKQQGLEVKTSLYPWAASGRAQATGRTEGMTKVIADPKTDRIVGYGVVGAGAGELIAEGVLAVEMGATIRDIADTIHPHPTMSETLSFAGEAYMGLATEIYRPKRNRKR